MNTSGNTILITGGSAGIGLALVKEFAGRNNKIIITGRNLNRLISAASAFGEVSYIQSDVSNETSVANLTDRIYTDFPDLNILINNAGYANQYRLNSQASFYQKAKEEIELNYLGPVLLTEKLLPLLINKTNSAIVNVSSIAAYSPNINLPTYSASKAALHSFSQILRLTLSIDSTIKVFEVLPPPVGAEFTRDAHGGLISAEEVAKQFIKGFEADDFEMKIGDTAKFYKLMLQSPERALLIRNGIEKAQ